MRAHRGVLVGVRLSCEIRLLRTQERVDGGTAQVLARGKRRSRQQIRLRRRRGSTAIRPASPRSHGSRAATMAAAVAGVEKSRCFLPWHLAVPPAPDVALARCATIGWASTERVGMAEDIILITGGAGFIGSHAADRLLAAGKRVRVLDRLVPQVHGDVERPAYLHPDVELVRGDVRDRDAVDDALDGVDEVVHLAARVGVGQSMYELRAYT